MREELKAIDGIRGTFLATFERYGTKSGWKGRPVTTILLKDITTEQGKQITEHLWFICGKQFTALGLQPGEKIIFDARSKPYQKGYRGGREYYDMQPLTTDWKLSFPTNLRRRETNPVETLPLFAESK